MAAPAFLFSNNNLQLYHARFLPSRQGMPWPVSKQYPVSFFFYLKGPAVSLKLGNTITVPVFISKNRSQFLYLDKGNASLQWEEASGVEFVELRLKKEYLASLIGREPGSWASFFHLPKAAGNILVPEKPLALLKDCLQAINDIVRTSQKPALLQPILYEAKALELVAAFVAQLQQPPLYGPVLESHSKLALLAKKYIDNYKGKKSFTIISLAESLDTNETTLKQAFKSAYGKTLFRYFQEKNMQAALEALKGGQSVGDTAAQCGYSYISHFSVAFKKEFGVSPSRVAGK